MMSPACAPAPGPGPAASFLAAGGSRCFWLCSAHDAHPGSSEPRISMKNIATIHDAFGKDLIAGSAGHASGRMSVCAPPRGSTNEVERSTAEGFESDDLSPGAAWSHGHDASVSVRRHPELGSLVTGHRRRRRDFCIESAAWRVEERKISCRTAGCTDGDRR
ncbi:hypothetical protein IWZ00DRAFT_320415 [Phyllosticta capitalensis]